MIVCGCSVATVTQWILIAPVCHPGSLLLNCQKTEKRIRNHPRCTMKQNYKTRKTVGKHLAALKTPRKMLQTWPGQADKIFMVGQKFLAQLLKVFILGQKFLGGQFFSWHKQRNSERYLAKPNSLWDNTKHNTTVTLHYTIVCRKYRRWATMLEVVHLTGRKDSGWFKLMARYIM